MANLVELELDLGAPGATPPPVQPPPSGPPPVIQSPGSIVARSGVATTISDVYHYWGSDLAVSNTQDLATVDTVQRGQQRILRRLMTNPRDYLFNDTYGAGLPAFVGQQQDNAKVSALINSQILLEDVVAPNPPPVITVSSTATQTDPAALAVSIGYTDNPTGTPVVLNFTISKGQPN